MGGAVDGFGAAGFRLGDAGQKSIAPRNGWKAVQPLRHSDHAQPDAVAV